MSTSSSNIMLRSTVIFFVVIVTTEEKFVSQRFKLNIKCTQPRGDVCLPIRECPYFAELLENSPIPRPRHVIKVIREHQCGFQGNTPKVCCTLPQKPIVVPSVSAYHPTATAQEIIPDTPPDVTNHPNVGLLPKNCGHISNSYRITGGSKAALFEFPWMALVVYNTESGLDFRCGGTVISERYVITAAHCIANYSLAGVRLGEHNMNTKHDCDNSNGDGICSPAVQDFYIEEVIVHAGYNPTYFSDDIALIRLATPADFSKDNVKPICMPIGKTNEEELDGKFVTITGWGITETGYKSAELLKTSVPVVPNDECVTIYGRFSKISRKQICAGGYLGRDSCGGDSGGPLSYVNLIGSVPRYVQYGIVSYGPRHCGAEKQPGVYTRLSYYVKWILDNMK